VTSAPFCLKSNPRATPEEIKAAWCAMRKTAMPPAWSSTEAGLQKAAQTLRAQNPNRFEHEINKARGCAIDGTCRVIA
jgi:hypothetical protein